MQDTLLKELSTRAFDYVVELSSLNPLALPLNILNTQRAPSQAPYACHEPVRYREGKQVIGLSGRIRNRTSSFGECIWDCWIIEAFLRASMHCSTETLYMFEKPRLCLLLYSVGKIAHFFLKYSSGWNKPMSFHIWIKDQRHMLPHARFSHFFFCIKQID